MAHAPPRARLPRTTAVFASGMEARKVKTRGAGLRRSRQPDPAGRRRQAIGSSVRAAAPTWPKNDISRWNTGSCGFTSTKRSGDYRERRPRPKTKMRRLRLALSAPRLRAVTLMARVRKPRLFQKEGVCAAAKRRPVGSSETG